jgi:hypothetical protein
MTNFLNRAWIETQVLEQLKTSVDLIHSYEVDTQDRKVEREVALDWLEDQCSAPIGKPCRAQIIKVISID